MSVIGHQDPGLQPERTVLSWGRTLLAMTVISMFFVRWYPTEGSIALLPAAICTVGSIGIHLSQQKRYGRQVEGIRTERVGADYVAVFTLSSLIVVLAVSGLLAVWVI